MKIRTKFSALTVALAMGMVGLVGCNQPAPDSGSSEPTKYNVTVNQGTWTVAGIDAAGYEVGATVTFTVTPASGREIVSVAANRGIGTLTPTATTGAYSFAMPENHVNVTVTDREIKTYALALPQGKSLQVDADPVTMVLTYGTDTINNFTLTATAGSEHVSINGAVVTPVSAGEVTLAATLEGGTEPVASLTTTVLPTLRKTIAEAIADAWGDGTTAFANNNSKGSDAKSESEYILTGKVVVIGNPYNGTVEAVMDDGTDLIDLQCLSVTDAKPCPFKLGDVVTLKGNLQNHYGLIEISGYPDTITVVQDADPITTLPFQSMDGTAYDAAVTDKLQNSGRRSIVPAKLQATTNATNNRYNVVGASSKWNNGFIATTKSSISLLHEEGVTYEFEGYMLSYNTSNTAKYTNFFVASQSRLAATGVSIDQEDQSLSLNNELQLTYTTTPAGAGKVVSWSSSAPENVSVSETGLVKALTKGTSAVITLTVDGQTDTITITVPAELKPATAAAFLDESEEVVESKVVELGSTFDLNDLLTVTPADTTDAAVWTVEEGKDGILSVANGVVTPAAVGEANVTVKFNDSVSATIKVVVKAAHGQDVSDPLSVAEAKEKALALNAAYQTDKYTEEEWYVGAYIEEISTAYSETNKNFSFKCQGFLFDKVSIDDGDVSKIVVGASIVVKGYLHNYSSGYKINMQKNGESAPATQAIDVSKPTFITVEGASEVKVGQSITLTATVYPTALSLSADNWEVSNANATVSNGTVTGVNAGAVVVTASYGAGDNKISGSHDVTVEFDREYQLDKQALFGTGKTEEGMSGTGSYTATIEHTNDGFTVITKNINSGGTSYWDTLRFGRKNDASVAEIYTKSAVASAIAKVTVNLTQAGAADKVTAKVQTSTDGENWTDVAEFAYAVGEQGVELATPTANLYYKVVFTCEATGSNGSGRFNQFNLYTIKAA